MSLWIIYSQLTPSVKKKVQMRKNMGWKKFQRGFKGVVSQIPIIGGAVNYDEALKNREYKKNIQQEIFAREDNSIQRRVADLQAAGLSPVLAAGQGAGSGAVVSTEPVQQSQNLIEQLKGAMDIVQQRKQLDQADAQIGLLQNNKKK